jgi:hypothetical protein
MANFLESIARVSNPPQRSTTVQIAKFVSILL